MPVLDEVVFFAQEADTTGCELTTERPEWIHRSVTEWKVVWKGAFSRRSVEEALAIEENRNRATDPWNE